MNDRAISRSVGIIILVVVVAGIIGVVGMLMAQPKEQVQIDVNFNSSGLPIYLTVIVNNTGTEPVEIQEVWINNVKQNGTTYNPSTGTVRPSEGMTVKVVYDWTKVTGGSITIKLVSSKGNEFSYKIGFG
jgi:hypothetical protein